MRETWSDPWVGKTPWRRERLPTPVFWPGEFHGLYSPRGRKESDMTEQLSLSFILKCDSNYLLLETMENSGWVVLGRSPACWPCPARGCFSPLWWLPMLFLNHPPGWFSRSPFIQRPTRGNQLPRCHVTSCHLDLPCPLQLAQPIAAHPTHHDLPRPSWLAPRITASSLVPNGAHTVDRDDIYLAWGRAHVVELVSQS